MTETRIWRWCMYLLLVVSFCSLWVKLDTIIEHLKWIEFYVAL